MIKCITTNSLQIEADIRELGYRPRHHPEKCIPL